MTTVQLTPLANVLRDYSFAYTASHDTSVCERIMVDDYELIMGPFSARGRDASYIPAVLKQFEQYPGLGFTVLDLITTGDRAAMVFCEHGRSTRSQTGTSWLGVSLYRWDGHRLTQCRVEQDYLSRTRQAESGIPLPVPPPAIDPWTTPALQADTGVVEAARDWLTGRWWETPVIFDDEDRAPANRVSFDSAQTDVLDVFGSGKRVAFHARVTGIYSGGLGPEAGPELAGRTGSLYASGIVDVEEGQVASGRIVTDRLSFIRRIRTEGTQDEQ